MINMAGDKGKAERGSNVSDIEDEEELDEEPGEVIESAPPLKVGEEREIGNSGIKKKLLKGGRFWETPELGDEATVHYVGTLLDGTTFDSTRERNEPVVLKLGQGQVANGLDEGIITIKKGERALFTLPPELGYGAEGREGVPPNSVLKFEVELLSWITVVDVCRDGGVIKKILEKGEKNERPGDLDEVLVKYQVALADGIVFARTPEEGVEFYVKDGHLCAALPKAITTMRKGEKVKLIVQPQYAFGEEGRVTNDSFPAIPPNSVLNIDLELISFKPVINVTGDSKVFKKILNEGEAAFVADDGATVTISYTARLEDGTLIEKKGVDGEQPLVFVTDEEQVISGLDRAATTMKKGERALLTIDSDYGFGNVEVKCDLATVPPCSNLVYEVEMLDFIKVSYLSFGCLAYGNDPAVVKLDILEKSMWEMNNQQKIDAAGKRKDEGNVLFRVGKYERAAKKYDKAAAYVSEDGSFEDEEQKVVKALRVSCWLNGAACCLKLKDFHEAIKLCSKVLGIEFHNVKALYRRAQAFMETSDLVLAEMDVKKALETDPENREVKLLQKSLRQLKAESNKRDATLYSNMFSRMANISSPATKKQKVDGWENAKRIEELVAMEMESVADSSVPQENSMAVESSS